MTLSNAKVTPESPLLLVGFAAEAVIARRSGWPVAIGGATAEGAAGAARRAIREGTRAIVSFGLAGGLDPSLRPGTLVVANAVMSGGRRFPTDDALNRRLGGTTGHLLMGLNRIAQTAAEKALLFRETGAAAVDMESGAIAETGIPFAVLRAICDPAGSDLPSAASVALDVTGRLRLGPLIWSLLSAPGQIPGLIQLSQDAAAARRTLRAMADALRPFSAGEAIL